MFQIRNIRHGNTRIKNGTDYIEIRNSLMFEKYGPVNLPSPRVVLGYPWQLTSFELLPFYAKVINEFGYNLVISENSKTENTKTMGPSVIRVK